MPWVPLLIYGALLVGAMVAFAELAADVYDQELIAFDDPVLTWFDGVRTPALTAVARVLSFLGSVYVMAPVGLVAAFLLWRRTTRRTAVFFVLAVGGSAALNLAAKAFFARARPDLFVALTPVHDTSFPSGHTMGSAALSLAAYLITRRLAPRWQWLVGGFGLGFSLGVALSRPYLQVHYPSDVLAGWAASVFWVLGVWIWYVSRRARRDPTEIEDHAPNSDDGTPRRVEPT